MAGEKKHKAQVIVPAREGFNGWWAAGRHWASGQQYDVELTDEEVANLARRPGLVVLIGGKVAKPVEVSQTTTQVSVTADELAALEKFRSEQSKKETNPTQLFTLEKENRQDAIAQARTEVNLGTGSAQAPIQDREVLHGQPPPENHAAALQGKPIDEKGKAKK